MDAVRVVTDGTASLPEGLPEQVGLVVVPLHVLHAAHPGSAPVELRPDALAGALRQPDGDVRTSRPSPAEFAAAYRACGGADVVSVHVSARLSGTVDAAALAAREVAADGVRVRVVDARTLAMGLGFAALAAARTAGEGRCAQHVEQVAREAAAATTLFFYVDTLEHLRRGGRIGAAAALLGTALAVKPLLHVVDGAIAPLERVRTSSRALARLEELAVQAAGDGPVDLAVHHLDAPERAGALADRLRARLPALGELHLSEVGPVVGAHAGPGLLGVVVRRR
ncbi:MAG: DegV family protein [Actinomycetota bacterium]|nr:DegV family protein [Actinomycetota bacterium]